MDRNNWLQLACGHQTLTVRNFFYDWDIAAPAALSIERAMPQANGFVPPMDMTQMGEAAESRTVIGRFELEPNES
jgi:hypothetical protein